MDCIRIMDYHYYVKSILDKDDPSQNTYSHVFLCAYKINTSGKYPFLQYLLSLNNKNKELGLPEITPFQGTSVVEYGILTLFGLLNLSCNGKHMDYSQFKSFVEFDGYISGSTRIIDSTTSSFGSTTGSFGSNLYLFYDLSKYDLNVLNDIYMSSPIRFALIDEIVNHKHTCNIPIHSHTTSFFANNTLISFIYNEEHLPYESPLVGFVQKETKLKTVFAYTFGENTRSQPAPFGPYFYFSHLQGALKERTEIRETKESGRGIVRFALFTENVKYINNNTHNTLDMSDIKQLLLSEESNSNIETRSNREAMTMRITDYDGKWASQYDSVCVSGHIELDDGTIFNNDNCAIVLKSYHQQTPLSYHFVHASEPRLY